MAALNLEADASMITHEELANALGPHLVSTADRISARLGYRRGRAIGVAVARTPHRGCYVPVMSPERIIFNRLW